MNEPLPSMAVLLGIVRNLCRFRGGPQDISHSPTLLVVLLVASVVLDLGIGSLIGAKEPLLARSLLSTALLLGLCWVALTMRGLTHRYVQTASALVACAMAFSILILPLALLFGSPPNSTVALTPAQMLIAWLGLVMVIWKVCVDAHIVRNAIEAPFSLGFLLALSWAIADWALSRAVFAGVT
jgi:hypothetical protein